MLAGRGGEVGHVELAADPGLDVPGRGGVGGYVRGAHRRLQVRGNTGLADVRGAEEVAGAVIDPFVVEVAPVVDAARVQEELVRSRVVEFEGAADVRA